MGDFTADWLLLREPADAAARCSRLTRLIADRFPRDAVLHGLDLAAGTGANTRYLIVHLPPQQSWLLVDRDPSLLSDVAARTYSWGVARGFEVSNQDSGLLLSGQQLQCQVTTCCLDLATDGEEVVASVFANRRFVSASALLDLVSERWLRRLARRCRESGADVLFALTCDGRVRCSPEEQEDEAVLALVNRHQSTDKGFGAALGPAACSWAERCFASLGYLVQREPSDWRLEPNARELQQYLIKGWAAAASEIAPEHSAMIGDWLSRRLAHVEGNRSRIMVGHEDLAAWLP